MLKSRELCSVAPTTDLEAVALYSVSTAAGMFMSWLLLYRYFATWQLFVHFEEINLMKARC